MQVKTVATNTIFYQKMCLVSNNNTSITESWAVVDGENIVSYMVQTESGQTTYSKESQTMEYDKIKNIFSGYFDSTAVNADYVSGCKKYADDSYTISLNVLSEETHRLVELTINADFKLVKITADVEAIGPSAIGTKGVIEYKYGLDADTMPARGYHEEWED